MNSEPHFRDKFVAFVDILGFRSRVEAAKEDGSQLCDLLSHCSKLAQTSHAEAISSYGPMICPESRYVSRDLEYEVTQVSDCVVVSSEISPAGIVNLIHHIASCVFGLFGQGLMVRGYITRGSIFHKDGQFIGVGYQKALEHERSVLAFRELEDDSATPFVEIDPEVVRYIKDETDTCVLSMFTRLTKEDVEHGVTALFPFRHLVSVAGASVAEPENCKRCLNTIRESIQLYRNRLESQSPALEERANRKSQYYRSILDNLLSECDEIENFLALSKRPAIKLKYDGNLKAVEVP